MSLNGSLQIGRSGLLAHQRAVEVTGQNLANVATPGYHRQTPVLNPTGDTELASGLYVGRGVQIDQIRRQIDLALEGRVRHGVSEQAGTLARRDLLAEVEAIHNELTDIDLSSEVDAFFNAWSQLASAPLDSASRTLVLQRGETLTRFTHDLRDELVGLRRRTDEALDQATRSANELLTQIEELNGRIVAAEAGRGGAASLRDQRDMLLTELAEYLDISVDESPQGSADVFVGSLPIVLDGRSRGLELVRRNEGDRVDIQLVVETDKSPLQTDGGRLGALATAREQDVEDAIAKLDGFASQLIWQVNRIHTQGQGLVAATSMTAATRVDDVNVALNDPAAGLDFTPEHGSFQLHVTQRSTGSRQATQIQIDLDGLNGANTSLADLAAQLDAVDHITASIDADGALQLRGVTEDFEISFSEDDSGVLAALGLNTYFTGKDATDIAVRGELKTRPDLLASGREHLPGDNRGALAMAGLREMKLESLGGISLIDSWNRHIEDFATRLGQSEAELEGDAVVLESLQRQQQALSGVNADEEAINLLQFQRGYQASARFLTVVDEMMQTLLSLV